MYSYIYAFAGSFLLINGLDKTGVGDIVFAERGKLNKKI